MSPARTVFLTAVLGYKIYQATSDTSRAIVMTTGIVDQAFSEELQAQFRANDRVILYGVIGFGVLLVLSIFAAGIWITHKVAGPLYTMSRICGRVRDNKLSPSLRQLRKGDELQEFYSSFRDMYEALRARAASDNKASLRVLEKAGFRPAGTDVGNWTGAKIQFHDDPLNNQDGCKGATLNIHYAIS